MFSSSIETLTVRKWTENILLVTHWPKPIEHSSLSTALVIVLVAAVIGVAPSSDQRIHLIKDEPTNLYLDIIVCLWMNHRHFIRLNIDPYFYDRSMGWTQQRCRPPSYGYDVRKRQTFWSSSSGIHSKQNVTIQNTRHEHWRVCVLRCIPVTFTCIPVYSGDFHLQFSHLADMWWHLLDWFNTR